VTALTPVERDQRRRRRRREEVTRWGVRVLLVLLVFAVGIAVGQALHDNPKPNETVTFERTVRLPTGAGPGSTITP
jgi:ABC-type transporter Mla subunit MlaD